MKKLITIAFLFFTVLGFSQDSEIYRAVFENKENFRFLDFYDKQNRKKIIHYKVLDIPYVIHAKTFKYAHNVYYSKSLVDSLTVYSKAHAKAIIIDYANKISYLLTPAEQDYLYEETLKSKLEKVDIKSSKVKMIAEVADENLYFRVSKLFIQKIKKRLF